MSTNSKIIEVEVLTPVHIGSGREITRNIECLFFQKEEVLVVLDEKKVINIIGAENLSQWLTIIEKGDDLLAYLKKRKPDLKPNDIALRVLPIKKIKGKEHLREQIHTGLGEPYIPGSSLKGAIRTAWFADEVIKTKVGKPLPTNRKGKPSDQEFVNSVFKAGTKKENNDVFRLLRLGDIHFTSTKGVYSSGINLHKNEDDFEFKEKSKMGQLVECLPEGAIGFGKLQIPEDLKKIIQGQIISGRFDMSLKAVEKMDIAYLFKLINQHTLKLLKAEIAFLNTYSIPDKFSVLISSLKDLIDQISTLNEKECILRLSFGSGYRFITGGWQHEVFSAAEMKEVENATPRKNRYYDFPFTKTRRLAGEDEHALPLGFVKLKVVSQVHKEEVLKNKKVKEESRLAQLKLEEEASDLWSQRPNSETRPLDWLEGFIEKFPASKYTPLATNEIDALRKEDKVWASAKTTNTPEEYLTLYPRGFYVSHAQQMQNASIGIEPITGELTEGLRVQVQVNKFMGISPWGACMKDDLQWTEEFEIFVSKKVKKKIENFDANMKEGSIWECEVFFEGKMKFKPISFIK